jgi:hypothetical protein
LAVDASALTVWLLASMPSGHLTDEKIVLAEKPDFQ